MSALNESKDVYVLHYSQNKKVYLSFDQISSNFITIGKFSKDKWVTTRLTDGLYQGFNETSIVPKWVSGRNGKYSRNEIRGNPIVIVVFHGRMFSNFPDICLSKMLSSSVDHKYIFSSALARRYSNTLQAISESTKLPGDICLCIFKFYSYEY